MTRPRLLDLYCGSGGAGAGYEQAGFDIVGVDLHEQPFHRGAMIRQDVLTLSSRTLRSFDAIHASPPCQAYSQLNRNVHKNTHEHPDLVAATRDLLRESGRPYVIENVPGAPLENPILLCGTMFDEVRVVRHRLFESNVLILVPPHVPHHHLGVKSGTAAEYDADNLEEGQYLSYGSSPDHHPSKYAREMGIDWITGRRAFQCIPPAYTRFIGEQLLRAV